MCPKEVTTGSQPHAFTAALLKTAKGGNTPSDRGWTDGRTGGWMDTQHGVHAHSGI